MNAVIGSLIESLKQITLVYEPTLKVFKNDRQNTGEKKEVTIAEFISNYLTLDFTTKKGCIYNKVSYSQNIDCVVLAPNHPKLSTPNRDIIIAEGVFCAIEVKPDIRTLTPNSEFYRALIQIKSVKELDRDIFNYQYGASFGMPGTPQYFKRIPSVIFSSQSTLPSKTIDFIKGCIMRKEVTSEELPDIIITMDNGIIFHSPHIDHSFFNDFMRQQNPNMSNDVFIHIQSEKELTLAWFILLLSNFPVPIMNGDAKSAIYSYLKDYINNSEVMVYELNPKSVDTPSG